MSVESYVLAMPKVELNVRFEGLFRHQTVVTIAEQNDIPTSIKRYNDWVSLLHKPDYTRLDDLFEQVASWIQLPDDLSRLVYDLGVSLAKDNIRYAEIAVNPSLHMLHNTNLDDFMKALNDGRDRVERGWGIKIAWVMTVPRSEPRRADETLRWSISAAGRKANAVALGISGADNVQPAGQFERAFQLASKKEFPRVVQAGLATQEEGIRDVLTHLNPSRLIDAWGLLDIPEIIDQVVESELPVVVSVARAVHHGYVVDRAEYPLRQLVDEQFKVILSADMPTIYGTTLSQEYQSAVESGGLSLDELEEMALNAVRYSYMPEEEKAEMETEFRETYAQLRSQHLDSIAE